jgi:hypothetical protein
MAKRLLCFRIDLAEWLANRGHYFLRPLGPLFGSKTGKNTIKPVVP